MNKKKKEPYSIEFVEGRKDCRRDDDLAGEDRVVQRMLEKDNTREYRKTLIFRIFIILGPILIILCVITFFLNALGMIKVSDEIMESFLKYGCGSGLGFVGTALTLALASNGEFENYFKSKK